MKRLISSKMRLLITIAFLLAIMTNLNSCSKSTTDGTPDANVDPGKNEIWIQNMAFTPATIVVAAGTTIKWTNKDGVAHTVTSDTGLFTSGSMGDGAIFSQQFNAPGTFTYHCALHTEMKARVVVN